MLLSPLLQEYLIDTGSLPLPGIGQLTIQHTPAMLNENNKTLIASGSKIMFSDTASAENEMQQFTQFIAGKLSISNHESKYLLEKELGLDTHTEQNKDSFYWPEWNVFRDKKDDFNSKQPTLNDYLPSLTIEKIFRQPATAVETPAPLIETIQQDVYPEYKEPVTKDYWWVWALVIFIVSVLLIVFRYA